MIKKRFKVLFLILSVFTMIGCLNYEQEGLSIFPNRPNTWVGDPMPYYDNGKFNVFYLDDLRDGDIGFHPWSLFTTDNFY